MSIFIHPLANVEKGAELGEGVNVGAFCYIGKLAKIGDGSIIRHHATVEGDVEMGEGNEVYPYSYIGGQTQDLKFKGGSPKLKIGDENVFREYVTAHAATNDGEFTIIGSHNVFLAYSHIAHDCEVGNGVIMSSQSALGGHVHLGDNANIGWGAGVHQFCRVGSYAMLSACSKLVQDIPPYMLADGSPAEVRSINKVALERASFTKEEIDAVRQTYKILYRMSLNRTQAVDKIKQMYSGDDYIKINNVLDFIERSDRGLA